MNNRIIENTATLHGGGIFSSGSSGELEIRNNIIAHNNAGFIGGGIACAGTTKQTLINNFIFRNEAATGGGIHCGNSYPTITSNTITDNTAVASGGGIYCSSAYVPTTVSNTILWANNAPTGPEISITPPNSGATLNISWSDVQGGQPLVSVDPGCTLNWGPGMIDADPVFLDPVNADFHLTRNSPCLNSGDNSVVTESADFEGDPRICGSAVDMGADEYWYHLYLTGNPGPGGTVTFKVVGTPGTTPVKIYRGSLRSSALPTQYGLLYIKKPWGNILSIGPVPANGIATTTQSIPSGVTPGSKYYFQALHGPLNDPNTILTNMLTLTVE